MLNDAAGTCMPEANHERPALLCSPQQLVCLQAVTAAASPPAYCRAAVETAVRDCVDPSRRLALPGIALNNFTTCNKSIRCVLPTTCWTTRVAHNFLKPRAHQQPAMPCGPQELVCLGCSCRRPIPPQLSRQLCAALHLPACCWRPVCDGCLRCEHHTGGSGWSADSMTACKQACKGMVS